MKTFEEFLQDRCPSHTNNSPEGFEKWLEDLDVSDVMEYAEFYGYYMYDISRKNMVDEENIKQGDDMALKQTMEELDKVQKEFIHNLNINNYD